MLHRAAGLLIAADRPLPGFLPQPDPPPRAEDLRFHLEHRPAWAGDSTTPLHQSDRDASGEPVVAVSRSPAGFHFVYADGTRAWIDDVAANVWCTWPAAASLDDTCTYLYGPILALVLRLRGALAFHASAVSIGGAAIGFVGPHGAGKSTIAAALGAAGCPVLTDDVLHVHRDGSQWMAEPFPSMLKLWPDGARMALGNDADLPRIAQGWDKRALTIGGRVPAAAAPVPLARLACLGNAAPAPSIETMTPASALLRLTANSSSGHLLDPERRADEFRRLSSLVRDVACVSLTPPQDPAGYPSFVDLVLEWSRSVS